MKKSKILKLATTIIIAVVAFYLKNRPKTGNEEKSDSYIVEEQNHSVNNHDFLPTSTTGQVVHHESYSLSYNEAHEQAEWVAYTLKKSDISSTQRKRPYFIEDPKVQTKSAHWKNFKNSGYDKGHLCPAGDRKYSEKSFNETFFTSNVSPQVHAFNAGIWNKLEQKTRFWVKKYGTLYVVTGSVLTKNLKTIGRDKVSVPKYFYKVLLDNTKPDIKAIAFIMPHEESKKPLYDFVVSIDELEKLTGVDFFSFLPDSLENKLEASKSYKNWSFR